MNVLITILIIIGSLIALFLLVALFTKREFTIEKQVTINKPKADVFNYMKVLRNQEKYSVWVMKDPAIKLVYSGTDGTVGAKSAWESNDKNVGIGEQEITQLNEGESMQVVIRFKKPFEATNWATNTLTTTGDGQTKLVQSFYGKCKFPMNVMVYFMDKMVGRDMQKGLDNMKYQLEK